MRSLRDRALGRPPGSFLARAQDDSNIIKYQEFCQAIFPEFEVRCAAERNAGLAIE